jgi:hypothetical protein
MPNIPLNGPIPPSVEKQIVIAFRNGLINGLALDDSQCVIGLTKMVDPAWLGKPLFLVVPGDSRPLGRGDGAQEGGSIMRSMNVSVYFFGRNKLNQHSLSYSAITDNTLGTMDTFEQVRRLFSMTLFGNADGSGALLTEPLKLVSESKTTWEDEQTGIYSREFVFKCTYTAFLPDYITLTLADVTTTEQ